MFGVQMCFRDSLQEPTTLVNQTIELVRIDGGDTVRFVVRYSSKQRCYDWNLNLVQLLIGEEKKINRARFGKEDKKERVPADDNRQLALLSKERRVSKEVSFKSLTIGEEGCGGLEDDKGGGVGNGDGGKKKFRAVCMGDIVPLELQVREASLTPLRQSKVGFFKVTMDFQTFQDRLLMEGQHEVKAVYMGGNMVLLQCSGEGDLVEVMKFNKHWWDLCFSKNIPWKPNLVSECREIWIQIFGIPLHVWEEGTFKMVAGRFGVFVDFDDATVSKQRLDVARVKLRTVRRGMIDTVLQLKVQGVLFDVWVVEERCSCGDDRRFEEEVGDQTGDKLNSSSGDGVWRRDDGDLFSDGRTNSDSSETCEAVLGLQEVGRQQISVVADVNGGIRDVDILGQTFLEKTVGESLQEESGEVQHMERESDENAQIPSGAPSKDMCAGLGAVVGPVMSCPIPPKHCDVLLGEKVTYGEWGGPLLVGPNAFEDGRISGPVGPNEQPRIHSFVGEAHVECVPQPAHCGDVFLEERGT
ncbi:hypothetical protein TSUD_257090 [Trifolium subterraneum]|uniref:Uncharacterized protein n=1 Tax=Trifolium subterraneum TaxID=3900 RepID=A0A2Z6M915_TRISU|nr:hypothetical protein TSUD_257090 [Trifolium subterraneum]